MRKESPYEIGFVLGSHTERRESRRCCRFCLRGDRRPIDWRLARACGRPEYHERHLSSSIGVRDWIGHGPGGRNIRRLLAALSWICLCRCSSPRHAGGPVGLARDLHSQPAGIFALLCDTPPIGIAMFKLRPVGCGRTTILFLVRQPEFRTPTPSQRLSVACFRSRSGHCCLSSRGMIGAS